MNFAGKRLGISIGSFIVGTQLFAAVPEKYQTILDRNPFGLLPPPEATSENKPPTPPSDIKVTGFATMAGSKRVYLAIPPKGGKDAIRFFDLAEGQRDGDIEIRSILEREGEVRLVNAGVEMSLSLEKNGFQSTGGGAPAPMPGRIPTPAPSGAQANVINSGNAPVASPIYNPAGNVASSANPAATGGVIAGVSPGRISSGGAPSYAMASSNGGSYAAPVYNSGGTRPSNQNTSPGSNNQSPVLIGGNLNNQPPQANFPPEKTFSSPEEAYIHREAEKIHYQNTREYWVEYYRKLGWPADRPLPTDIAAQLSPSQ